MACLTIAVGLASCSKEKGPADFSGDCEAVDLGLSVKWASYNVGAISEYGKGAHFAWGETMEKEAYNWNGSKDYLWGVYDFENAPLYGMTKYTAGAEGGDGKTVLLPEDDPATRNWGKKWRTPTVEEFKELLDRNNCEWSQWDPERKGYTVRSLKTGKTIFIPALGIRDGSKLESDGQIGYYWTSSVDDTNVRNAYHIMFDTGLKSWRGGMRKQGMSVRAVTEY